MTENPAALRRWMASGPEAARMIKGFENVVPHASSLGAMNRRQIRKPLSKKMSCLLFQNVRTLETLLRSRATS